MARTEPEKEKKQRKEFLKQASDMLQDTKKQALREMQGRVKEETEGVKDEGRDTYDLASDERDESAPRPSCLPNGSKKLKSAFKDAIKKPA